MTLAFILTFVAGFVAGALVVFLWAARFLEPLVKHDLELEEERRLAQGSSYESEL